MNLVYTEITSICAYEADWPGVKAEEVMAWFQSKINLAPEEHRSQVMITIGSYAEDHDDSSKATLDIGYYSESPLTIKERQA